MKERTGWWIATTLLALLVLEGVSIVNCEKSKAEDRKSSTSDEKIVEAEDLEGSETTYVFPYQRTVPPSFNSLPVLTKPIGPHSFNVEQLALLGQNISTSIHREIACGDTWRRMCQKSRYRTFDGSCNNLYHPTWGMANTRFSRLLPPNYGDGISTPTRSVTGAELPLSRLVSFTAFPNVDIDDPVWTLVAMQWGQIITHDMSLVDGSSQGKPHKIRCCTDEGQLISQSFLHDHCNPIVIPYNDPIYSKTNIRCLNFVLSSNDIDHGCSLRYKPAEQLNTVTHFLDLSLVYGSSDQAANNLRVGVGGRLNVDVRHNKEWPPASMNKSEDCDIQNENEVCYLAGDSRVNQSPQLTILQTLLLREHNRVADILARLNPHWTDETTYQEARRIVIAEHQHISYYEWLPIFLGTHGTYGNKILYNTKNYVNDYNPSVNPSVLNEHTTGAFRYFHSLVAGYLSLVSEERSTKGALRISDHFNRPGIIEEPSVMDDLTRGMGSQPAKNSDRFFDPEITHFLFRNGRPLGSDLRSIDIHRSRAHGLASYNSYRHYCGLPRAKSFADFGDHISPEHLEILIRLYASHEDVEVTVGAGLERHVQGALAGPTFLCILARQFYRTRVGDRFWYERGDHDLAFTIVQLNEIRKASISRLFCDNGNDIKSMQLKGFQRVSQLNPVVSCHDIPSVDLSAWKDYAPVLSKQRSIPRPYYK